MKGDKLVYSRKVVYSETAVEVVCSERACGATQVDDSRAPRGRRLQGSPPREGPRAIWSAAWRRGPQA